MPSVDPENLLERDRWLRRAARGLLGDSTAAEDSAQDAWVLALGRERAGGRGARQGELRTPRAWLFGVLRNLGRASRWRRAREQVRPIEASEGGQAPPADELAAELELQARATEALAQLEEPLRSALYLRFVRELALEEIARRTQVAPSTVHARIERGLAALRQRLDREYGGDRGAWALCLLSSAQALPEAGPGALGAGAGVSLGSGSLVMGTSLKLAATLAAIGTIAFVWSSDAESPVQIEPALRVEHEAGAEPTPLARAALDGLSRPEPELASRHAAADTAEPQTATREPALELVALRGRVLDTAREPLADVLVGVAGATDAAAREGAAEEPDPARATSRPAGEASGEPTPASADERHEPRAARLQCRTDAGGRFELLAPASAERGARARCLDASLCAIVQHVDAQGETLIVVAARADFAGRVVDEQGLGLANVRLQFGARQALFRSLGIERPWGEPSLERATRSDASGEFELLGVGGGPELALSVTLDGYQQREIELPAVGDRGLLVVLERENGVRELVGTVVDVRGAPVEGARVAAGMELTTTDASGGFVLSWLRSSGEVGTTWSDGVWVPESDISRIWAVKPGLGAAHATLAELDLDMPIVLRLGAASESIEGRVVDGAGAPVAGVLVWERTAHPFGYETRDSGGGKARIRRSIEELSRSGEGGALTDAEGRFRLGGLLSEEYELMLEHLASATRSGPIVVEAGRRELELVLAREPATERVAGHVRTSGGDPIEGVWVRARRSNLYNAGSQPPWRSDVPIGTHTDAEGAFEFRELATRGTALGFQHELFFQHSIALEGRADLDELEVVPAILCELQLELVDPERADHFRVLDAEGRELELLESFGAFLSAGPTAQIEQGRSGVVRVSERGLTLLLEREEQEVARLALELQVGQRTTLRL